MNLIKWGMQVIGDGREKEKLVNTILIHEAIKK